VVDTASAILKLTGQDDVVGAGGTAAGLAGAGVDGFTDESAGFVAVIGVDVGAVLVDW